MTLGKEYSKGEWFDQIDMNTPKENEELIRKPKENEFALEWKRCW